MFKKFLSLTLALVMALGLVAGAVDYKDASNIADYAKKAVQTVNDLGLMQGDDKGNFNPKSLITRQEMMRVIYSLDKAGLKTISNSFLNYLNTNTILDVADITEWAKPYAGYSIVYQLFQGDGAGKLNPKGNITYTQVAVVMLRAMGYTTDYIQFRDSKFNWDVNAVMLAMTNGLFENLPSNINYNTPATREDVAVILTNALKVNTVRFSKDADAFLPVTVDGKAVNLESAKYGVMGAVQGLVVGYGKDYYMVSTSINSKNEPINEVKYTLASGETLNPALVGETVRWTFRNGKNDNRITNLAKVADAKRFENVNLADIKWDGEKLNVGSEKIDLKGIATNNILFYAAGNGVNGINYDSMILDALKVKDTTIAEPYKLSVSYNKVKINDVEKHIIGVHGMYDVVYGANPVFGLAKIAKIDGVLVELDIISDINDDVKAEIGNSTKIVAIANDLTGLAKGDIVYVKADFADMLLEKNNDKDLRKKAGDKAENTLYNVDLTRVAPVQVAAPKFSTKIVSGKTNFYIDGKEIKQAWAVADEWRLNFDHAPFKGYDKDQTYNVYAIDNYVYKIEAVTGDVTSAQYHYGIILDEYYTSGTNGAAFVKVLAADGTERVLEVAAVGKVDASNKVTTEAPKRSNTPVSFDAAGFPVFGVTQFAGARVDGKIKPAQVVSYTAQGDKFIVVYDSKLVANDKETVAVLDNATLTKAATASGRTLTQTGLSALYTKDTVFFVVYKGADSKVKNMVLSLDGIKATQLNIDGFVAYKELSSGGTKVATVAVLDLSGLNASAITLIEATAAVGDSIVLTAVPVVNFVNGEYTVTFSGFVGNKYVADATYEIGSDYADLLKNLAAMDQITLKLKDNEFVGIDGTKTTLDKQAIVEYVEGVGFITLKNGTAAAATIDFADKANFFYLDKKGNVVDAYTAKAGDHTAAVLTKDGKITTIIFQIIDK